MTRVPPPDAIVHRRRSWRAALVLLGMRLGMMLGRPLVRGRVGWSRLQFALLGWIVSFAGGVRVARRTIGGVPTDVIVPDGAIDGAALVYLHGGGYTIGSARTHRGIAARLAKRTRRTVYVPDYRLAPEHPFPAALDDAIHVWPEIDATRIALAGESAGGGLALALAQRLARDRGRIPERLYLLSPWLDLTLTSAAHRERDALDPMLKSAWVESEFAHPYAGTTDRRDPRLSPLFGDARALPPTLLQVGTHEVLHDDTIAWAARLREANVPVTLEIGEGLWHAWPFLAPLTPESSEALDRAAAFLAAY